MTETIGRYRLIRQLGKGATATVHLVEDETDGQQYALKLVRFSEESAAYSRRIKKLFMTEGNVGRQMNHPNIARVYDCVVEEEQAYLVMEFVPGKGLDAFLRFDTMLPIHQVISIIFKCALALDYAYHKGVIHRDLKPANIMLDGEGNPKLTDFGLALNIKKTGAEDSTFIMGVGSPAYMSPEQIKNYPLDQKSDIYSLGIVLYQMLTGRFPFSAKTQAQLVYKIINADAPLASILMPSVPKLVDPIIKKCLEKDLYSRYKNGAELAKDLSAIQYQIVDDDFIPPDTKGFEALRSIPFFRDFMPIEIWEVMRISKFRDIEEDCLLMQEGELDDSFGILVEGSVEVSMGGKRIAVIEAGEPIGETSFMLEGNTPRTATITTLTPIRYLEVSAAALALGSEECQENFRKGLIKALVGRYYAANQALAEKGEVARKPSRVDRLVLELEPMDIKPEEAAPSKSPAPPGK